MVLPIRGEYHYSRNCPYCKTFDNFVLSVLEIRGYLRIKRYCLDLLHDHPAIYRNYKFARAFGLPYLTPLLILEDPKRGNVGFAVIIPKEKYEKIQMEADKKKVLDVLLEEVRPMARDLMIYLYQLGEEYNFSIEDVLKDPFISKAIKME